MHLYFARQLDFILHMAFTITHVELLTHYSTYGALLTLFYLDGNDGIDT